MKNILFSLLFVALVISFSSCTKDTIIMEENTLDSINTKEQFAYVLSKAASENESLRAFLKNEALLQFDNDYDVFYPYVKDKIVEDNITFRKLLLSYIDEDSLRNIEVSEPLLCIMIPDWSWIGAFDVNSWDTSGTDVLVGYSDESRSHLVYENGKQEELEVGVFPISPILIVKSCERIKIVGPLTKSEAEIQYDYVDDAFRPNIKTKVAVETSFIRPTTNPGTNWVSADSFNALCPEAVVAWNEYGTNPSTEQRRYTSFSMRNGDNTGALNSQIRESILAIKLYNKNCMDVSNDPSLKSITKKNSDYDIIEDIIDAIWDEGQLEILLRASYTDQNGETQLLNDNMIAVDGKDLFDISRIQRDFYHKTMFSARKYVYIPSTTDLVPKWYYLPSPLAFKLWDPSASSIINIHAYEVDPSIEITVTDTVKSQQGVSISGKVKEYFQLAFNSNSSVSEKTYSYKIKADSDDLGQKELRFSDYIITSSAANSYALNYYSTGSLDFIIVPQSLVK